MFDGKIKRKGDGLVLKNCKILVMMNKIESFDMIVRKAIAYGYICIFANNLCLLEIFISADIYYSPGKGKLLAEII